MGHWKDFNELEESLSMKELMATLSAMYEREHRHNKFMAQLQGVDIEKENKEEDAVVTFEEIKARAALKVTGDIQVANAERFGFKSEENGTTYAIVGI